MERICHTLVQHMQPNSPGHTDDTQGPLQNMSDIREGAICDLVDVHILQAMSSNTRMLSEARIALIIQSFLWTYVGHYVTFPLTLLTPYLQSMSMINGVRPRAKVQRGPAKEIPSPKDQGHPPTQSSLVPSYPRYSDSFGSRELLSFGVSLYPCSSMP